MKKKDDSLGNDPGITPGFQGIDLGKLTYLLEKSFNKYLDANYYSEKDPSNVYIIGDKSEYLGAVIIEETEIGFDYMDKIASTNPGDGVGKSLLTLVGKNHPALVWRSNPTNKMNNNYLKHCQGFHKEKDWFIFWTGLNSNKITDAIAYSLDTKVTLHKSVDSISQCNKYSPYYKVLEEMNKTYAH